MPKRTEKWVDLLTRWYKRHARLLPWRANHNPYFIWVSEVMLQQTQVATVIPYYTRFLDRFPTIETLAEAPESDVLNAWSGLGYYSRARNLQRGARYLIENFDGKFPRSRDQMITVPGIGPYTAGAILSIAFDLPAPIVDGNVQRVFARFYGFEKPLGDRDSQKFLWARALEWVSQARSPRLLNQGLMELGATVCGKSTPRCSICPLQQGCSAFRHGNENELPRKKARANKIELHWLSYVLEAEGRALFLKNPPGEWWSDLWDLPRIELEAKADLPHKLSRLLEAFPTSESCKELNHHRHTVTHHCIRVVPYLIHLPKIPSVSEPPGEYRRKKRAHSRLEHQWLDLSEVSQLPVSSLVRKILRDVT